MPMEEGGPVRKSLGHPCRIKIFLVVYFSRKDGFIKRSRFSTCCIVDHERSKPVLRNNTCIRDEILSLKTLSFRHSQSDHITANALTLIIVLSLLSIPFSQLPKIFATDCFFLRTENTLFTSMPVALNKIILS